MQKITRVLPVSLVLMVVLFFSGCYQQSQQSSAPTPTTTIPTTVSSQAAITISNFAFTPSALTVKAGTTVTWTNQDGVSHTVTSQGVFNSGVLANGQSFQHLFDTAGTFDYGCSIHPSMKGKIIVE